MGITSGSLIEARHTVNIFPVILVFLALAIVAGSIFLITQYLKEYKKSAGYLKKIKNRPTKYSDVVTMSKICNLTKEETEQLWEICNKNRTSNILFLAKDKDAFEELIKKEFYELKERNDQEKIFTTFMVRKKLFASFIPKTVLKSSKAIEGDTIFVYTAEKGVHYNLDYKEKTNDGLYLRMPPVLAAGNQKPKSMQKLFLTFTAKDDTPYQLETRAMRFQKDKFGDEYMVCAHSDHLTPLKKRSSYRVDVDLDIQFSAVKVEEKKVFGIKETTSYIPLQHRYTGKLLDISTGGCRMLTRLPIKPNQHIYIEGMFNMMDTDHATGIIVRTTKRRDGLIVLHIKFVEIETATKNRILAMIHNY